MVSLRRYEERNMKNNKIFAIITGSSCNLLNIVTHAGVPEIKTADKDDCR
jgi:hypothetical protein